MSIINEPLQIKDSEPAEILRATRGEITFDNVGFSYAKNSEPLFCNKSLLIKSGEKVGLVGHSGGGKTTFVNLILRFFDVNSGLLRL